MKSNRGMNSAACSLNTYTLMAAIAGASLLQLTGCVGPLVKIEEIDPNVASRVQVFRDKSILQKENVTKLGIVEATSCKNLLWQPESSLENCTEQLRMKAARIGGNGIVLASSDGRTADFMLETGINRNCWNTVDCSAVVIFTNPNSDEKK